MKIFAVLFLLLFSFAGYGQQNAKPKFNQWQPLWYLDSVNVGAAQMRYINPDNIEKLDVTSYHDPVNRIKGKIYIKTKDSKRLNFLTISDIVKTSVADSKTAMMFMVDNEFLTDTTGIKIDSSYILRTEILKGSEIDYLKDTVPNLIILKIFTRTKQNVNSIRIRGTVTAINKRTEDYISF